MNSSIPPSIPPLGDEQAGISTTDLDGDEVLDPDANDDLTDSAEADRVAAEEGIAPESP